LRLAALCGFTLATLGWLAREPILNAYTSDAATASAARKLIALALAFHVFDALQIVSVFVLRSYKVTVWPMIIYGVCLWGIGLGGGYWLAYRGFASIPPQGSVGLWSAALAGLSVAALALVWLTLYVSRWHLRVQHPQASAH
jgi:MATE family multidrug resistance protein